MPRCAGLINVQTLERPELDGDDFDLFLHELQLSLRVECSETDVIAAERVGDLFDAVIRQMGKFDSSRCLTSLALYPAARSIRTWFAPSL